MEVLGKANLDKLKELLEFLKIRTKSESTKFTSKIAGWSKD